MSFIGKLVRMDLPQQKHYCKTGVIIRVRKPTTSGNDEHHNWRENRIRYDILCEGEILEDQLYEYFVELGWKDD